MISLGIETTAHTFGIGIVTSEGKVLSDERDVYRPKIGEGIIPVEAAKHHESVREEILKSAVEKACVGDSDIDIVSYSAGPGLPPCLSVGAKFATLVSDKWKKPAIQVNHSLAHLEIGKLTTGVEDPIFVYLSGGNTQIIAFSEGRYRIFGETLDIPVGNCLDLVARKMGLPSPGGPQIEKFASGGKFIDLPYVVKGMDLSFSGIATEAVKKFGDGVKKSDIAYSLQETSFAMLTEVTERALAHTDKKEVLLVGGVAANRRLQEMMNQMCRDRSADFFVVPSEYSGDQGVMIAWAGLLLAKCDGGKFIKGEIKKNWRIDEIDVCWI